MMQRRCEKRQTTSFLLLKLNRNRNMSSRKNNLATLPKDRAAAPGLTVAPMVREREVRRVALLPAAPGPRAWLGSEGVHATGPPTALPEDVGKGFEKKVVLSGLWWHQRLGLSPGSNLCQFRVRNLLFFYFYFLFLVSIVI